MEDGGTVHSGSSTDTTLAADTGLQVPVDTSDREVRKEKRERMGCVVPHQSHVK